MKLFPGPLFVCFEILMSLCHWIPELKRWRLNKSLENWNLSGNLQAAEDPSSAEQELKDPRSFQAAQELWAHLQAQGLRGHIWGVSGLLKISLVTLSPRGSMVTLQGSLISLRAMRWQSQGSTVTTELSLHCQGANLSQAVAGVQRGHPRAPKEQWGHRHSRGLPEWKLQAQFIREAPVGSRGAEGTPQHPNYTPKLPQIRTPRISKLLLWQEPGSARIQSQPQTLSRIYVWRILEVELKLCTTLSLNIKNGKPEVFIYTELWVIMIMIRQKSLNHNYLLHSTGAVTSILI